MPEPQHDRRAVDWLHDHLVRIEDKVDDGVTQTGELKIEVRELAGQVAVAVSPNREPCNALVEFRETYFAGKKKIAAQVWWYFSRLTLAAILTACGWLAAVAANQ